MTFYEIDILIIDVLIVWFVLAMFKPNLFAGFLPGNSRLRILIIFLTMLPPFLAGAFLLDTFETKKTQFDNRTKTEQRAPSIKPDKLPDEVKDVLDKNDKPQDIGITKKRLDIPVNVGKRFLGIGHVQAGPVFSYYFDDKLSVKDFTTAKQDEFNVGMQIGAGVEVSKLLFDLRYEFGLGKVGSDILNGKDGQYRTENRPQMLNLSVAYLF